MACLRPLLALLCLLALPLQAPASPVTYSFSGVVDSDDAGRGWLSFTGSFSFDSATPDGIPAPSSAAHAHAGAPWGMSLQFDGEAPLTLDAHFDLLVSNDLGGSDQLGALARSSDGLQSFSLTLFDVTQTLFTSDTLPGASLQLADFTWSSLVYESSGQGLLQGRLTSLGCSLGCGPDGTPPVQSVAEPTSTSLLTLGLMCAWLGRRRTPTTLA